jgi:hypothetical protein
LGKEEEDNVYLTRFELLKKILEVEEEKEEEEDDYCIYQPLVYPPNSNQPNPEKKTLQFTMKFKY